MSENILIKVSLYGDQETGKTSLAARYLTGEFTNNYIQTLGVGFRDKEIMVQDQKVVVSIWDIGGSEEFYQMIPLSADGSNALIFVFDLTNMQSLISLKQWYKNVRQLNPDSFSIVVGTKYDKFESMSSEQKQQTIELARKYAKAMGNSPLVFTSASKGVNVVRLFKHIICMVFGLESPVEIISDEDKPVFEYDMK